MFDFIRITELHLIGVCLNSEYIILSSFLQACPVPFVRFRITVYQTLEND
jgi:hypothetical protein